MDQLLDALVQFPGALLRLGLQPIFDCLQSCVCRRQRQQFLLRLHPPVIVIGQRDLACNTIRGH